MRGILRIVVLCVLVAIPGIARGEEFNPAAYAPISQTELSKNPDAHDGKKYRVSDPFQFCGSDFCVQIQKTKINTREYYCITLGPLCLIRFYIKKDHPDAEKVGTLKKGDMLTLYGTFDHVGSDYRYMVLDRLEVEKKK
ncbi:MAG TPA: hypothetical protein VF853_05090 [Candidatus Deferrimicrobiaceae bacterium]